MSQESTIRPRLNIGTWLTAITVMAAIIGSYTLAQSQIADHNKRIVRLEARDEQTRQDFALMRELLIRIDERTVEIKRKQDLAK